MMSKMRSAFPVMLMITVLFANALCASRSKAAEPFDTYYAGQTKYADAESLLDAIDDDVVMQLPPPQTITTTLTHYWTMKRRQKQTPS